MKLLQICLFLILGITSLSAFTFDKWKSGTELEKAVQVARTNNLPLMIEGKVSVGKRFDWRYLKGYKDHRAFYYYENLLGARSKVTLYFTQDRKKLYKVLIRWSGIPNKKEFEEQLYRLMDKKYGNRNIVVPGNVGEYVFFKKRLWNIDKNSVLQSKASSGGIDLVYLDKKYEFDDMRTKEKKKLNMIITDAEKF